MSTDRELLQAAAKAADVLLPAGGVSVGCTDEGWGPWNPLLDDGDAFRLAVKLDMDIICGNVITVFAPGQPGLSEDRGDDNYAAMRRAIVRAAAKLGEQHDA